MAGVPETFVVAVFPKILPVVVGATAGVLEVLDAAVVFPNRLPVGAAAGALAVLFVPKPLNKLPVVPAENSSKRVETRMCGDQYAGILTSSRSRCASRFSAK